MSKHSSERISFYVSGCSSYSSSSSPSLFRAESSQSATRVISGFLDTSSDTLFIQVPTYHDIIWQQNESIMYILYKYTPAPFVMLLIKLHIASRLFSFSLIKSSNKYPPTDQTVNLNTTCSGGRTVCDVFILFDMSFLGATSN